ncbi:MAG: hypothetical protein A2161_22550 [Candidatus Schekmanbacteria bacterium RBG_13_48_7]|uniref:Phthiocerol/phthiodiolone dimycocerosyl transferase n=1 Tax=Candidatus Schekmanbacteria bacterium RBG_13_48_7 TaxID=1817878 RepID=A0A1F7RRY6_9BACT|nr:MAG: hypothetical protein A2161_22550 [Candidatus Schekmanbacteria bacterium RBG_13_48_7]
MSTILLYIAILIGSVLIISTIVVMIKFNYRATRISKNISGFKASKGGRMLGTIESGLEELNQQAQWFVVEALSLESEITLDIEVVRKSLLSLSMRHPLLRMKIKEKISPVTGEIIHYFQEMDNTNTVDLEIIKTSADDWISVFEDESLKPIDSANGPLWRGTLLTEIFNTSEHKYNNTIIFSFHHCIIDGTSIFVFYKEFLDSLMLFHKGGKDEPSIKSLPLQPSADELLSHHLKINFRDKLIFSIFYIIYLQIFFRLNRKLQRDKSKNIYLKKFPPLILKDRHIKPATRVIPMYLTKEETTRFFKCCKDNNSTVNGAISAAAIMSIAKILQDGIIKKPVTVPTTFNIDFRNFCHPGVPADSLGCVIGICGIKTTVPVLKNLKIDFWDLARNFTIEVRRKIEKKEPFNMIKIPELFQLAGISQKRMIANHLKRKSKTGRLDNVLNMSNLGRHDINENRPYELIWQYGGAVEHNIGPVFGNVIITLNGRLLWTLLYFTNIVSDNQAKEYINSVFDILKEAC